MKSNRISGVLICIIIISLPFLFIGCSYGKNQVIGRWESSQISQDVDYKSELTKYTIFEFTPEGILKLGNKKEEAIEWRKEGFKYSLLDNNVIVINGKDKAEFKYKVNSSKMTLTNDSIEIQLVKIGR